MFVGDILVLLAVLGLVGYKILKDYGCILVNWSEFLYTYVIDLIIFSDE